jgi:hypothetical protein
LALFTPRACEFVYSSRLLFKGVSLPWVWSSKEIICCMHAFRFLIFYFLFFIFYFYKRVKKDKNSCIVKARWHQGGFSTCLSSGPSRRICLPVDKGSVTVSFLQFNSLSDFVFEFLNACLDTVWGMISLEPIIVYSIIFKINLFIKKLKLN